MRCSETHSKSLKLPQSSLLNTVSYMTSHESLYGKKKNIRIIVFKLICATCCIAFLLPLNLKQLDFETCLFYTKDNIMSHEF